jgi:hypothetical protein
MYCPSQRQRFHEWSWRDRLQIVVVFCTLLCGLARSGRAQEAQAGAGPQAPKIWKVLMIGNSYTYFNNMPKMFEQLALADQPARRVQCEMIVQGGATLQRHWEAGRAIKAIERGGWDFVILQEQSTLGETLLVEGLPRIGDPSQYFASARRFHEAIGRSGPRTVIFAFWARENVPPEDHDTLDYVHHQLGKELGAVVAPVGLAWRAVRQQKGHPALYRDDHSHPASEGSYLAACVLYAACFGAVPADPPRIVTGKRIDTSGQVSPEKEQPLVEVSQEFAHTLRDAANASLTSSRQFARELDRHKPVPPHLPQLERGRRPTTEELEGDWTGESTVYPRVTDRPAAMTLRLTHEGESWQARAKIAFGGNPSDIVLDIGEFQITDDGISFVDRNKQANGGSVARYRGAFAPRSLSGIAEITSVEARLRVIGSWTLKKK